MLHTSRAVQQFFVDCLHVLEYLVESLICNEIHYYSEGTTLTAKHIIFNQNLIRQYRKISLIITFTVVASLEIVGGIGTPFSSTDTSSTAVF